MEEAVEYIFQEHCFDDQGNQTRRLTGVGISLGAAVLANLAARLGKKNRFDAHFGLCCHFDWRSAYDFLKQKFFGFFDYVLGLGMLVSLRDSFAQFDQLAQKKFPERLVGHLVANARTLTIDFTTIAAISGGFTYEEYLDKSDVTTILHKIEQPFFFMSAEDDTFFGSQVIPISHCYEKILIGVTKTGGHCGYLEGLIFPTRQWWT